MRGYSNQGALNIPCFYWICDNSLINCQFSTHSVEYSGILELEQKQLQSQLIYSSSLTISHTSNKLPHHCNPPPHSQGMALWGFPTYIRTCASLDLKIKKSFSTGGSWNLHILFQHPSIEKLPHLLSCSITLGHYRSLSIQAAFRNVVQMSWISCSNKTS